MKIYMAGDSMTEYQRVSMGLSEIQHARPWRILISWYYYKSGSLEELFAKYIARPYPEVFLDSGAYSAFMQKGHISLNKYAKWIHRYKHLIYLYANVDVIGNQEATLRNQRQLEQKYKLSPLPVFHVSEPWHVLDAYLEKYSYIALGGMVPYSEKILMSWLVKCFRQAGNRAVFHGFGCTKWEILKAFPWYSVDSTTWGDGFRYGNVPLFDSSQGRFVKVSLGDHASCYKYASILRSLGFDPQDFASRSNAYRQHICALSALSYMKAEEWLEQRHGVVAIPRRIEAIG